MFAFSESVSTRCLAQLSSMLHTGAVYNYSRNSLMRPPKGLSQKWSLSEVVAQVKGYWAARRTSLVLRIGKGYQGDGL